MELLRRQWWFVIVVGLLALLALEVGSGIYVRQRSDQLYASLDNAHALSLGLTRSLGYGGLIHHFKNQVLRPAETDYSVQTRRSAAQALEMLGALENEARQLGLNPQLNETRAMIAAYTERLEELPALTGSGLLPGEIDPVVRFNDRPALNEIDALIGEVRIKVRDKVDALTSLGSTLFWLSSATMAILALVLLKQLLNRRRDFKAIEKLNTDLAASVKRLEESNIALKQFAGIVSHDLKAPLRHIGFFGTLISEEIENANTDEAKRHITDIEAAIGRMDNLIEGLLDFTKTGFTEPHLAPVNLNRIASDAVQALKPMLEQSGAIVTLSVSGTVNADATLLSRVFENLISNSIKYARQGVPPRIEIRSTVDKTFLHLAFSDNGIGIPVKYAERVFEPFQRLHSSRDEYDGNGIGLSLVKTVVEAHAGAVRLDPDYTGGTRIVISLLKNPVTFGSQPLAPSESPLH